ncbi:MAG: hypothetical protein M1834_000507 [Cirrosporium novae-zelandiae]|nr:MAG: hypothetical protein M1834_000507 [Cirrosporium novae-zelandiae]
MDQNLLRRASLIDVGSESDNSCALVEGASSPGEYITLSYCWGKDQPLCTLKANVKEHMTGILLHKMPKTLREAVLVTRKLGLRYLWIDALCIVQDDSEEWRRAALQMGNIYQNSFCTIAAAGSASSRDGLFIPRHDIDAPVAIPYVPGPNQVAKGEFYIYPARHTFPKCVQETTWNKRGWVLQERILSRRIILFAEGQTFFECQRSSQGEDRVPLTVYGADWDWCLLVEDYTQRALTQPGDKLYALAGLAENMARQRGKQYSNGIWCENLHLYILWCSKQGIMERPLSRRAPSWSWAALDGPIFWEPSILEASASCKISLSSPATLEPETEIAYLINLETHSSCFALLESVGSESDQGDQGFVQKVGWWAFDQGKLIDGPFYAALVSENNNNTNAKSYDPSDEPSYNALILKRVPPPSEHHDRYHHDGQFSRVGMGEIIKRDWFKTRQLESITIS